MAVIFIITFLQFHENYGHKAAGNYVYLYNYEINEIYSFYYFQIANVSRVVDKIFT